jgi:hypothetical protein
MTASPRHLTALAFALALLAPAAAPAQMMHPGGMFGAHHGADGTGHDEMIMPGLRGLNATPEESAELATLFRHFETLTREVENLPDGIRTVTRSSDEAVMEVLISHVAGMIGRVETGDDPQIFIQSTTLDITDAGIVVVQTSADPDLVAALHLHAAEVSDMAERGMAAVHDMMMQRAGN